MTFYILAGVPVQNPGLECWLEIFPKVAAIEISQWLVLGTIGFQPVGERNHVDKRILATQSRHPGAL